MFNQNVPAMLLRVVIAKVLSQDRGSGTIEKQVFTSKGDSYRKLAGKSKLYINSYV